MDVVWTIIGIIDALLDKGAAVDGADSEGRTPLMHAVNLNHVAVFERLLRAGANRYCLDNDGKKAMDLARYDGCDGVCDLFGISGRKPSYSSRDFANESQS